MNVHEPDLEELFHAALERPAGPERRAFLDGALGSRPPERARLEALLAAHEQAQDFLESPALPAPDGDLGEIGKRIGPYKLLQEIGEGGMGVVYMAEQEQPVRRRVALKVIKLGMDTRQVIARFEAERQALALMDHPCIARVLDAGATETGRPYFVMELVRGVPIREYCDTNASSARERLQIFVNVCRGIQHAHQKGVIHRDIKPGNVLVTLHDGKPVPKIIDFGVAKATSQRLTEKTLFTEFRQFIGTPEYMSPEQAEMSGLDVDTRSDIYSLGVLLYELLTGTTPVDAKTLRSAGYGEMTRMIREAEPQAPSTRVSKMAEIETIARQRRADPAGLARDLRGDLDWIVMKALEKDRTRRYDSAASLADDVERHLASRPVEAGPPSSLYRLGKFVRRNRSAVGIGSLAALLAIASVLGIVLSMLDARRESARSAAIADSLQDLLASSDPARAADPDYDAQGALRTSREVFGEGHPTVAATAGALALQLAGAGNYEAAEPLYREAIKIWTEVYGEEHLNVALTRSHLGSLYLTSGKEEQAEAEWRAALTSMERLPTGGRLASCATREALANLLAARGEQAEASSLLRESIAIRRETGVQQPQVLQALEQLASIEAGRGPSEEADWAIRETYLESRRQYPEGSGQRVAAEFMMGNWLFQTGRNDDARAHLVRVRDLSRENGLTKQPFYLYAMDSLFQILRRHDDDATRAEADAILAEVIDAAEPIWTDERMLNNLGALGSRLLTRRAYGEALEAFARCHDLALRIDAEGAEPGAARLVCAKAALGHCSTTPDDRERAVQLLEVLNRIQAGWPLTRGDLVARAWLSYRAGSADGARNALRAAAQHGAEEGWWQAHELALRALLSEPEAGQELLRRLRALGAEGELPEPAASSLDPLLREVSLALGE